MPAKPALPKKIRFAELVKLCGQPETVTLWTKPEAIPPLQKAIRQRRILTILQNPHKKEFGLMGFEQHQSALYLVFPKPLPKAQSDAEVIGIKYELFADANATAAPAPKPPAVKSKPAVKKLKPVSLPKPVTKPAPSSTPPKPVKKKFKVSVVRTATSHVELTVSSDTIAGAESEVLVKVKRMKFSADEVQDEVKSIAEIK
jgi:hypothetical protein